MNVVTFEAAPTGFKFENTEHHMLESIKALMNLPVSTTKRLGMIRAVLE